MKTFKKRLWSTMFWAVFSVCLAVAQTSTIKHTVDRGETLTSIAQRYGTTEAKIIELNPDAKQFIYVGMELIIPNNPIEKTNIETNNPTYSTPLFSSNTQKKVVKGDKERITLNDFSYYGASYFASFEEADKGFYMLGGTAFHNSGWGIDFHIGANYGLVDSDFAGSAFLIGPAYGYAINNILVSASLDFMGTYTGCGEGIPIDTGYYGNDVYSETDLKFGWGITLMPQIGIKLGKVTPCLGVNATWTKGAKELDWGFQVGIGIHI